MHPSQLSLHQMVVDYSCSLKQRQTADVDGRRRRGSTPPHICCMWIYPTMTAGADAWELAALRGLAVLNKCKPPQSSSLLCVCVRLSVLLLLMLVVSAAQTHNGDCCLFSCERARGGGARRLALLLRKVCNMLVLCFVAPKCMCVCECWMGCARERERTKACRTDLKLVGNEKWLWSCVSGSVLGNCQRCRERALNLRLVHGVCVLVKQKLDQKQ